MRGYGQFCPIAKASEVLGERWTHLVIREIGIGTESFNDIRKGVPLMSPSLLSTRLKSLERAGVIDRDSIQGHIRYRLSKAGEELMPIILQMGAWGHRWVRSDLSNDDLDPGLLIWDMHRGMNTESFTADCTVLKIEFTDMDPKKRFWWLVVRDNDVDVCVKDPGYEVDLLIASDLRTLTAVWMGDTTIMNALREKLVSVTGATALRKNIAAWLGSSYYADVKAASR